MNEYLKERDLWWPVNSELMASYNDGSHTSNFGTGGLKWYKNGLCHRDGDKPAVIYADGTLIWFKNGLRHRDGDKPARIWADGTLAWWKNHKVHRTTGPAIIRTDNKREYWINGVDVTKEVEYWLETRQYKYPFTPEQAVEFTLTFG